MVNGLAYFWPTIPNQTESFLSFISYARLVSRPFALVRVQCRVAEKSQADCDIVVWHAGAVNFIDCQEQGLFELAHSLTVSLSNI